MGFDPNNKVFQLCSQGMEKEAELEAADARRLFLQAWHEAGNDFEKFVAAHYLARHQESIEAKLKWDELALSLALKLEDITVRVNFPSLYLNIGQCHEELGNFDLAHDQYTRAESYIEYLPDNGYGQMIKAGIKAALTRISEKSF